MQLGERDASDDELEEATFQLWETKRHIASYLMSSKQREEDTMLVLVISADKTSHMRSDLSRFDLLNECRKSVPDGVMQQERANLHLEHSRGAMLQLRDIRALQDVHHPSLMVRIGAILLSMDPLKAIITRDRAFVVVPDGADNLFEPLYRHIRQDQTQDVAFEFLALEALLVTLVSYHKQVVHRCEADAGSILKAIRKQFSSKLLNKILLLKRSIHTALLMVQGAQAALEEVQQDHDQISLMFLSHMSAASKCRTVDATAASTSPPPPQPPVSIGSHLPATTGSGAGIEHAAARAGGGRHEPGLGHSHSLPIGGSVRGSQYSTAHGAGGLCGARGGERSGVGRGGMGRGAESSERGSKMGYYDVMQAEVLLDSYALEFAGLGSTLLLLEQEIEATEDYLKFRLDSARNKLIRLDVLLGMVGTWFGFSSCITGFYGMNLPYGAYTDGTVKPGQPFQPPTGGAVYDGPFGMYGPSWPFFVVALVSTGGVALMILITCACLRIKGLLRT